MPLLVKHLSESNDIGLVGPRYPGQPEHALQALRNFTHTSRWWPEPPDPGPHHFDQALFPSLPRWAHWLPAIFRRKILERLSGLNALSPDATQWRAVLTNLAPKFLEALNQNHWNSILLSQSTSAAWYPFIPHSLVKCLYLHDVRSDYLRHSPIPPDRRTLARIECEEKRALVGSELVMTVSEADAQRAASLHKRNSTNVVVPICVDLEYYRFRLIPNDAAPIVLFTGHLAHPPNVDALEYLLNKIWPLILENNPDARLHVAGKHPSIELESKIKNAPSVELFANLADMRPQFNLARVYIVPMRYGGGVRQKLVEAWACGIPVVSTSLGVDGLNAKNDENCWITDDPATFAKFTVKLLQEPVPSAVVERARYEVEQSHSPTLSGNRMHNQIKSAVNRRMETSPKVLFDLRWVKGGHVGGVQQMTQRLLHALSNSKRGIQYQVICSRSTARILELKRTDKLNITLTKGICSKLFLLRHGWVQDLSRSLQTPPLSSPEIAALEWYKKLDFTMSHGIPSYVHPEFRRFPNVVTIHDLQHLHFPDNFTSEERAIREREYRESCHSASHIICPSEYTRNDVHLQYGVSLDKITVISNLLPETANQSSHKRIRNIPNKYFIYPSQPWKHKNHTGLFRALLEADSRLDSEIKILLTGQPFPTNHPARKMLDTHPELQSRVKHLGFVSPSTLASLYQHAIGLIYPSLFEGFGLPLLEAMQYQCPVICGNHSSLPEVVGNAAMSVDVSNPSEMAKGLIEVSTQIALRHKLVAQGNDNLRRFDTSEIVQKTESIYLKAHAMHAC